MSEVIKAERLTKVFNKHLTAVDHVNFSVNQVYRVLPTPLFAHGVFHPNSLFCAS